MSNVIINQNKIILYLLECDNKSKILQILHVKHLPHLFQKSNLIINDT